MNLKQLQPIERAAGALEALRAKRSIAAARLARAKAARASDDVDLTADTPEVDKLLNRLFRERMDAEMEIDGLDAKIAQAERKLAEATASETKAKREADIAKVQKLSEQRRRAAKELSESLENASSALRDLELAGSEMRNLIPQDPSNGAFGGVERHEAFGFKWLFESFSDAFRKLNLPMPIKAPLLMEENYPTLSESVAEHDEWMIRELRKAFE